MLSIFKLGSSAAASKYYEKADYYTKGEVGVDVSSQWVGGGVPDDKLGLPVEKSDFKELLDGNMRRPLDRRVSKKYIPGSWYCAPLLAISIICPSIV